MGLVSDAAHSWVGLSLGWRELWSLVSGVCELGWACDRLFDGGDAVEVDSL